MAAVVVLVVGEIYIHRLGGEERALLAEAPEAAGVAGCGSITTTPPYPGGLDRSHIGAGDVPTQPSLSSYPSLPPASGPHGGSTMPAGVYRSPPPMDRVIHSLEHGAVVIWVDASSDEPEIAEIRSFFARGDQRNHVIVAPYDYPEEGSAGRLPQGKEMALVAWHRVRLCDAASLPVAYDFVYRFRFNIYQRGAYQGDAPEKLAPI